MASGNTTVPSSSRARIDDDEPVEPPTFPALVMVWSKDEPWRVGEVAVLVATGVLPFGRGIGDILQVEFGQQRPGEWTPTGPLGAIGIGKREADILVDDDVRIRHVANSAVLKVNGQEVKQGVTSEPLVEGDLVELVGYYIFRVTERPAAKNVPRLQFWKEQHPFGDADFAATTGESEVIWELRDLTAKLAPLALAVLVYGESGSGKEAVAHGLHVLSRRRGEYIRVNMATLKTSVGVAQLFGHKKGFPQAGMPRMAGFLEAANGGTVFLDEIGEVGDDIQASLLRAVLYNEISRIGESEVIKLDVRYVAATNRPLHDAAHIKFDLVPRLLNKIRAPSLNERPEDIMLIARDLMRRWAAANPEAEAIQRCLRWLPGRDKPEVEFHPSFVRAVMGQWWHTNVGELAEMLSASLAESPDGVLRKPKAEHITWRAKPTPKRKVTPEMAREAVARHGDGPGARAAAAAELGISRHQLRRLLQ